MLRIVGPIRGRIGAESLASWGRTTPGRALHHDGSGHVRMQRAEIFVGTRRREGERELVVGVEHLRLEGLGGRHHRVRDVVLVGPGDGGPGLDGQALGREGEVVDLHLRVLWCRRQERSHDGEAGSEAQNAAEHGATQDAFFHCRGSVVRRRTGAQACSGVSTMASRCWPGTKLMLAVPSTERSLASSTFMGPGDGAEPGAGCGKAVERAVWKATLPSTFWMIW